MISAVKEINKNWRSGGEQNNDVYHGEPLFDDKERENAIEDRRRMNSNVQYIKQITQHL